MRACAGGVRAHMRECAGGAHVRVCANACRRCARMCMRMRDVFAIYDKIFDPG